MKIFKKVRLFPLLLLIYLIEFVIVPIRLYAFTVYEVNEYNFSEATENDRQILVTNNLGRAVVPYELVYLDGFFGEVREADGIADAATGRIKVDHERIIRTTQIEVTDTFTVGNVLHFVPGGSSAAGELVDAAEVGSIPVGIITGEGGTGGAQTYVEFRPFAQGGAADKDGSVKQIVFKVDADASTALPIPGLKEGDEIVGAKVICTATNASGTLVVEDGAGDDITDGIACDTDTAVDYAATIDDDYSTLPATGAAVISVGGTAADTRGIVVIDYIPA